MEQLTCELNGVKYLLIERYFDYLNNRALQDAIKENKCILQGTLRIHPSLIGYKVKILVPENNVHKFNTLY
jgi:hypothetical protein